MKELTRMNLSAKSRFTTIMVVTASVAMMLVGALAWFEGRKSLEQAEYTHLTGVREAKSRQVEDYFEQMRNQLGLMSEDQTIVSAMVHLSRGFRLLNENAVGPETDAALQDYYANTFRPKLAVNAMGVVPDVETFLPRTQPGRYLQEKYIISRIASGSAPEGFTTANDGSAYSNYHAEYHKGLADFLTAFGFYDVFLIDFDTSDVVYSVFKEADFGTNLTTGPYRNTGLAKVVRKVQDDPTRGHTHIVDFQPYAPSLNQPASFMAAPIFNGPYPVGIIAFQIPVSKIENIMTSAQNWREEGLGESGETYIIGPDYLMRSVSRFLLEDKDTYFAQIRQNGVSDDVIQLIDKLDTTILLQKAETRGARAALRGEEKQFVADDYRGVSVLTATAKLDIDGLDWGIVTEINEEEAFSPIGRLLRRILISTAIFIPIVAYLSFLLSQQFMTPVRQLTSTARDMRARYDDSENEDDAPLLFETDGAAEYKNLAEQLNGVIAKVNDDMRETRRKKEEYTDLITAALPASVSERLQSGEDRIIDNAKMATVVFMQVENFDSVPGGSDPAHMMNLQSDLDEQATTLGQRCGVDVFHQMGMELIGVCGLTMPYINHSQRGLRFVRGLFNLIEEVNERFDADLKLNIGIAVSPLYGELKTGEILDYDIIGDAISIAREAGYAGPSEAVNITPDTRAYFKTVDIKLPFKASKQTAQIEGVAVPVHTIHKADVLKLIQPSGLSG